MINGFAQWAAASGLPKIASFDQFNGTYLGIDAEHYVDGLLTGNDTRESLLPAHGGIPFQLTTVIGAHIQTLKDNKITPFFIFNGLSVSRQRRKLAASLDQSKTLGQAWDLYNDQKPEQAVAVFGTAPTFDVDHIYRHIQSFLHDQGVMFLVAPHSASAQLAFFEVDNVCDAVYGSNEILMYDVDRMITDIDFDSKVVTYLVRSECLSAIGLGSKDLFVDACLLAGSSLVHTLPHIENDVSNNTSRFRAAAELLRRGVPSGNALCLQYQDHPLMQQSHYLDEFRKASMIVKHSAVLTYEGKVENLNKESLPNDSYAFLGQRLPDEIIYYQSRGLIGLQVLTWRTTGEIIETPPLDGGLSVTYQMLVRDQLVPQRAQALSLLSHSLHRFYQFNNVSVSTFFNQHQSKTINIKEGGDPKNSIADWNVRLDAITERAKVLKRNASSLAFAIGSLNDSNFAKKTITPIKNGHKPLTHSDEITCNTLWKFLSLRGYIASDHTLTPLGKCLEAAYSAVGRSNSEHSQPEIEEAVLLALELQRLKLLNSDNMFPSPPYYGAPNRGTEVDKQNNLLVSRVACLGRLAHNSIGYTGPLSRHLLAYRSLISTIRSSQRDILEMTLTTMLLSGNIDRKLDDHSLQSASFSLPFLHDFDCALGIAVKHYLDELSASSEDPTSDTVRDQVKAKGVSSWFPHAISFTDSLDLAFTLWDAVFELIKHAPEDVASKDTKEQWGQVNEWLSSRR